VKGDKIVDSALDTGVDDSEVNGTRLGLSEA
jgi:hypothetical protein